MTISVGDVALNYVIDGEPDKPWLIFSNSIATDTSLWDDQVRVFRNDFRIVRYDQRGHGLSQASDGAYSIDLVAQDLLALMDALEIERASLVGISMGAMTVLTAAKHQPERVERLVVCDCGPAASEASASQWRERIEKVSARGMASIVDETLQRWFTPASLAQPITAVAKVSKMVTSTSVAGFIGCAQALSNFDLRPGLELLEPPALFVSGEHDAVYEGTRFLHENVPDSLFARISDAGHLCNLENPRRFAEIVGDFLAAGQ